MRGKAYLKTWLMLTVFLSLITHTAVSAQVIYADTDANNTRTITISANPLKDSYAIGRQVPLEIVITNHSPEPVYTTVDDNGYLMTNVKAEDANGLIYPLLVPDPPYVPPRHWWIEVDGKKILTVPVIEIEPNDTITTFIQDALDCYYNQLQAGTYNLRPSDIEIIHKVDFIINRENLNVKLWIDPHTIVTRSKHQVNEVELTLVQKIIYVDDDASGANDGSSWENAYTYLQDALADANNSEKPVEIRVARGIYKPDQGEHQKRGDQQALFRLINEVTIKGGFAGFSEANPDAHNIELYKTVLSGDLAGNDADVNDPRDMAGDPTRSDNSRHILSGSNTNSTAVLDGFTITGGYEPMRGIDTAFGGAGMINYSGSSTLVNCTFIGNAAGQSGGGLLNLDNSNPTLISCIFSRNYSGRSGGGMCNSRASWQSSQESNPTLINCIFHKNVSNSSGAAISNSNGSIRLNNCTFSENIARSNGAGIYNGNSNPMLNKCEFINNQAEDFGGGMYNNSGSPQLKDCQFIYNSSSRGGGMYNDSGNPNLDNCRFIENSAQGIGGGLASGNKANPKLIDCIFTNNSSNGNGGGLAGCNSIYNCMISNNVAVKDGGAVYGWGEVVNCTITGNKAHKNGGGICTQGVTKLINSILWNNNALSGKEIYLGLHLTPVGRSGTPQITPSEMSVSYSNIQGGEEEVLIDTDCILFWEAGNTNVDPLFVDPGYRELNDTPDDTSDDLWIDGDYHLKSQAGRWDQSSKSWVIDDVTSPCIDAGDPNSPVAFESFPNGGRINMGAYGGTAKAGKSPSGLHAKFGGGTGEPNNPYLIYTPEQMNSIVAEPNDLDKHFKLMADIDLGTYTETEFNIIGTDYQNSFRGVFDGNGHSISNFTCETVDAYFTGIFGRLRNGIINDLKLIDTNVDAGEGNNAGSLVGMNIGGTISGCSIQGGFVKGGENVGGLVGDNGGIIINCSSSCIVDGNSAGGLVGSNCGSYIVSEITMCYSKGIVSGNGPVGGLVGQNGAMVPGHGEMLFLEGLINNCYSTCSVSGNSYTGGLVGFSEVGTITHCYSNGSVLGNENSGGFAGKNNSRLDDCFWDIETSGQTTSDGGTDKTTAEMQTAGTFLEAGWDFVDETENGIEDIWRILEGRDYPRLWWEITEE